MLRKNETPPKVSIGMPVYNGEQFLRQAIDSILSQTFENFELIIADNASTDATPEICRDYERRDGRVRFVAHEVNRGAAQNHHYVLAAARGPYFTWAHSDDYRMPRCLERCVQEMDRAPASVVVICTEGRIVDERDEPKQIPQYTMDLRQARAAERLRQAIRNGVWCNVIFGLIRTDTLRACLPLGGYPFADLTLIHDLALHGQFWEIREDLFRRRWHEPWSDDYTAHYMDPRNQGAPAKPHCKVFTETMRAIGSARLPALDAMRSRFALIREWVPRYWRPMKNELRRAARTRLRRLRRGGAAADPGWKPERAS